MKLRMYFISCSLECVSWRKSSLLVFSVLLGRLESPTGHTHILHWVALAPGAGAVRSSGGVSWCLPVRQRWWFRRGADVAWEEAVCVCGCTEACVYMRMCVCVCEVAVQTGRMTVREVNWEWSQGTAGCPPPQPQCPPSVQLSAIPPQTTSLRWMIRNVISLGLWSWAGDPRIFNEHPLAAYHKVVLKMEYFPLVVFLLNNVINFCCWCSWETRMMLPKLVVCVCLWLCVCVCAWVCVCVHECVCPAGLVCLLC